MAGILTLSTDTPKVLNTGANNQDFSAPMYGMIIVGTPPTRSVTKPWWRYPPNAALTKLVSSM